MHLTYTNAIGDSITIRRGIYMVIQQSISVTALKSNSEHDLAREFRNMSRKLAMGV